MADIKDRAREYLAEHSEYSEVFGQTFVAVDTLTAMVEFAEQETKELKEQIEKTKCCGNCKNYNNFYRHCEFDAKHSVECHCNNYKLWEIKEK
jgi:hypothetical protein